MPALQRIRTDTRYPMAYFVGLRREMLRAARTVPCGPERNQRRQIAASLRSLLRNKVWQDTHTLEGSRSKAASAMCDRCNELEEKIARYRRIMEKVPDAELAVRITKMIQDAEAEKAAFHHAQQK